MTEQQEPRCTITIAEGLDLQPAMPRSAFDRLAVQAVKIMDALGLAPDTELSIQIVTDENMQQLNQAYRGVDSPTDVLSFTPDPLPPEIAEAEAPYLGDLIIAYHYTLNAAQEAGHYPPDEFALLVVHGMLHLAGYDHDMPENQRNMWAKQAELLSLLNIDLTVPDFIHHEDEHAD
jgi:probable rRNA maturation factor